MKKLYLLLLFTIIVSNLFAQLKSFETEVPRKERMKYFLYTPEHTDEPAPLVIFLHGGGEGGDDIELVKMNGLPKLISEGQEFPFYVFAPQNPYPQGLWDDRMIDFMTDQLVDTSNIDVKRIYLVGMSRGGYGVWRMAINNPGKYAAMISICAATIPMVYVNKVASMPVWFFHGEKDTTVPVGQTIEAYEIMKSLNPETKLTLYPEANHDSWTKTFENQEVYDWMLLQGLK